MFLDILLISYLYEILQKREIETGQKKDKILRKHVVPLRDRIL